MSTTHSVRSAISETRTPTNWCDLTKRYAAQKNSKMFKCNMAAILLTDSHRCIEISAVENRKPTGNFSALTLLGVGTICHRLTVVSIPHFASPNSTTHVEVPVGVGGRKWHVSKCRPHLPIRLLHTPWAILHRFAAVHFCLRRTDRWLDRSNSPNVERFAY